ncbi:hypothetical protein M0813_25166 [Anaeramoeba flamelloides]|uniref:Uncharacterized protein n=1 Tax=Anaeramoeba flamelloides TaxID=1746091 RepID=A0ABQ8Y4T0_9EUKA|nr:hypothetical protein M0813_25166 [Anaeramoeba flamelloides]
MSNKTKNNKEYEKVSSLLTNSSTIDQALKKIKELTCKSPDDPKLWVLLGEAFTKKGLTDKALFSFSESIRLKKNNPQPHYQQALIYNALPNKDDEAFRSIKLAIKYDKKNADYYSFRSKMYLKLKNNNLAFQDLNRALLIDPKRCFDLIRRGSIYQRYGQFHKANDDFYQATKIKPASSSVLEKYVNFLYLQRNWELSIKYLKRGIKLKPHHHQFWYQLANCYNHLNKLKTALECYSKSLDLSPENSSYWCNRGSAYDKQGNYDQAISDCTKAIEMDPQNARFYYTRGLVYRNMGKFQKSLQDFDRAIKINPTNSKFHFGKATVYEQKSHWKKVIENLKVATSLNEKIPEFKFKLGSAYLMLTNYEQAITFFNQAIKIKNNNSLFFLKRGIAYFKSSDFQSSLQDFNTVIKIISSDTDKSNSENKNIKKKSKILNENINIYQNHNSSSSSSNNNDNEKDNDNDNNNINNYYNHNKNRTGEGKSNSNNSRNDKENGNDHDNENIQAKVWNWKGKAELNLSQYANSIVSFSNAIKQNPKNPIFLENRAKVFKLINEDDKALQDQLEAIKLKTQNKIHAKIGGEKSESRNY